MYMGELINCEWKMEFDSPDVFRIYGTNEKNRSISPSSPQSFEIQGNHVLIETLSGNKYHLMDVVDNENFMKELREAVERKQYWIG